MTSRKRLVALMPPVLADRPPPRGPSLQQRRADVTRTLRHAAGLSDRTIAAWCLVSNELVARIRKQLVADGVIADQPERVCMDRRRGEPWTQRVTPNPERKD